MTWGLLHADPAPEHFRLDATSGRCGLIDWSVALEGPMLADLASAVMYVGGPDHRGHLVEAYLRRAVVAAGEVERSLTVMLRFRWPVQADYFAWRIATHDLTGSAGPADNEKGLDDRSNGCGWLIRRPRESRYSERASTNSSLASAAVGAAVTTAGSCSMRACVQPPSTCSSTAVKTRRPVMWTAYPAGGVEGSL